MICDGLVACDWKFALFIRIPGQNQGLRFNLLRRLRTDRGAAYCLLCGCHHKLINERSAVEVRLESVFRSWRDSECGLLHSLNSFKCHGRSQISHFQSFQEVQHSFFDESGFTSAIEDARAEDGVGLERLRLNSLFLMKENRMKRRKQKKKRDKRPRKKCEKNKKQVEINHSKTETETRKRIFF